MKWQSRVVLASLLCSSMFVASPSHAKAAANHGTAEAAANDGTAEAAANHSNMAAKSADVKLFEDFQQTLGKAPVDAKHDRVWHAIPGLCGWELDVPQSVAASKKEPSGSLRLVWKAVPPKVRLSSLDPEPIYRGPAEEKSVALMFNVAWGEADLPSILSTLDKYHVKATFFMDGDWVKKNPQLAKQIAQDGQTVGSHGTGHPDFRRLSNESLERQITETNERIQHTIGRNVNLLAPPAGAFDERVVKLAHKHNMYTILWTVDTIDWNRPPANVIVKRVMNRVEPGSFVLMHPTPPTASALPVMIERLTEQGYRFKTIDDVVSERPATHPPQTLRRQS